MQHHILLGCDRWTSFEQRSYTTLPQKVSWPTLVELSPSHDDPDRDSAFIPENCSPHDIDHVRYAGAETISLSAVPTRVNVNLARRSGASVFTRNYVDNMIPRDDFLGDTEMFVSDAYQTIRDSGSTNLDPDDFLRISPSPLVQAALSTFSDPSGQPPSPPPRYTPSTATSRWPTVSHHLQTPQHHQLYRAPSSLHA